MKMAAAQLYLPPMLALIALSFAMALAILFTRSGELIKGTKPISYFEDFDGSGASVAVMRPTRQLVNLFEFPVLFYTATAILIALSIQDGPLQKLFWAYALFRWLHAISHLLLNRLWIRTPIFALGNVILLTIWIRICLIVFV
jgi:hypothetical protein